MNRLGRMLCLLLITAVTQGRDLKVSRSLSDQLAVNYIEMAKLLIDDYPSITEEDRRDATRMFYRHLFTIWLQTQSSFKVFSSDWEPRELLRKNIRAAIVKYADLADPLDIFRGYGDDGALRQDIIILLPHPLKKVDIKLKQQYNDLVNEFKLYIQIEDR